MSIVEGRRYLFNNNDNNNNNNYNNVNANATYKVS